MKEALLHMLFVGVVLFAASYLKKDNKTTTGLDTQVQTRIDRDLQRNADSAPALALVRDTTVKLPRRK
ncbi:hypothetical protein SAMN05428988_0502 [Chitinophaga sp. YR573]|uniref:hypothetical protein n=1 Tax=Chitinophaga sp. YR573 TaxID=1881040 RepID=UPI0008B9ADE2|nr:hypothetical protein [Chitinophaga sp. YR573]SEV92558.1 hypothetical protein SAMN05428988_0502 [Chitinophaga sp. YR573]